MLDIFDNAWGEKQTISLEHCVDVTLQVNYKLAPYSSFTHVVVHTRRLPSLLLVLQVSFSYMWKLQTAIIDSFWRIWSPNQVRGWPRHSCWPSDDVQGLTSHCLSGCDRSIDFPEVGNDLHCEVAKSPTCVRRTRGMSKLTYSWKFFK